MCRISSCSPEVKNYLINAGFGAGVAWLTHSIQVKNCPTWVNCVVTAAICAVAYSKFRTAQRTPAPIPNTPAPVQRPQASAPSAPVPPVNEEKRTLSSAMGALTSSSSSSTNAPISSPVQSAPVTRVYTELNLYYKSYELPDGATVVVDINSGHEHICTPDFKREYKFLAELMSGSVLPPYHVHNELETKLNCAKLPQQSGLIKFNTDLHHLVYKYIGKMMEDWRMRHRISFEAVLHRVVKIESGDESFDYSSLRTDQEIFDYHRKHTGLSRFCWDNLGFQKELHLLRERFRREHPNECALHPTNEGKTMPITASSSATSSTSSSSPPVFDQQFFHEHPLA